MRAWLRVSYASQERDEKKHIWLVNTNHVVSAFYLVCKKLKAAHHTRPPNGVSWLQWKDWFTMAPFVFSCMNSENRNGHGINNSQIHNLIYVLLKLYKEKDRCRGKPASWRMRVWFLYIFCKHSVWILKK